jgi:hypothetical protein
MRDQTGRPETPIAAATSQPLISDELNYGEFKVLAEFASAERTGEPNETAGTPTSHAARGQ